MRHIKPHLAERGVVPGPAARHAASTITEQNHRYLRFVAWSTVFRRRPLHQLPSLLQQLTIPHQSMM